MNSKKFLCSVAAGIFALTSAAAAFGQAVVLPSQRKLEVVSGNNLYCAGYVQMAPFGAVSRESSPSANEIIGAYNEQDGWNFSENFISEKNMMGSEPWEFGYALGASRPLTLRAAARECMLCRERFAAGAELYGGLGTTDSVGLRDTSHYLAPVVAYETPRGPRITFSPGFGLNNNSIGVLYRVGVSYEFQQFFSRFHHEQVR